MQAIGGILLQVLVCAYRPCGALVKPCKTPSTLSAVCRFILAGLSYLDCRRMPSLFRVFLYFLFAVLLSSALGSVVQTQFNLANLQALGAPMTLSVRLHTTALDLLGFSPLFAVLVLLSFIVALPAATLLSRSWPVGRWLVFASAGAAAVWAAMSLANSLAPMPTLIGANRCIPGTLGLMACGSVGALLFALLMRRVPASQA